MKYAAAAWRDAVPDVIVVQNSAVEGPGLLGELLCSDGFTLDVVHARRQKIPESSCAMCIILGAQQSANDGLTYLDSEIALIRRLVANEVPVLGICLGSQLVAKAFGAKVYQGPRKEIGFFNDLRPSGRGLFSGFDNPFTAFHWHGETFDLPPGAERLASSGLYRNQAIKVGTAVGLQFHLEVDRAMVRLWLDRHRDWLAEIPYVEPGAIRQDLEEKAAVVEGNMERFYRNFKAEFNL